MNNVRTGVKSVWKRSWTFLGVILQRFGSERVIHGLPVGGCDVRNSSNSFALRWRVFSSEVAKLKWFCFDLALKLALYTSKKKKKKSSHNTVCVTYKAK